MAHEPDERTPRMTIQEFPLPANSGPSAIAPAPDGSVWVGLETANQVVQVLVPSGQNGLLLTIPTPSAGMGGLAFGANGLGYLAEYHTNKIAVFDPVAGQFLAEYVIPVSASGPSGLVYQPATGDLWILLAAVGQVIRMGLDGSFPFPTLKIPAGPSCTPHGPCVGGDGNVWFGEISAAKVCKATPAGVLTEYPVVGARPTCCTAAADNGVYFTDQNNRIWRIDLTSFALTKWTVPTPSSVPYGCGTTAAGDVIFSERSGNKIGILPLGGGTIQEQTCPTPSSQPNHLCLGGDGAVWVDERAASQVARVS